MASIFPAFRSGAIAPLECVKEGWALIKDQYWLFLGLTIVGILIASAVPIVLIGPMMVGIFLCLFQRQRHEPVEFGTLFKGFDYFGQSLIVALIKVIPIVILMVPFYIIIFAVMLTGMPLCCDSKMASATARLSAPDESETFGASPCSTQPRKCESSASNRHLRGGGSRRSSSAQQPRSSRTMISMRSP